MESNLSYKERRTIDLVHQVLNKNSNMYQENKNISDLFRIYGRILSCRSSREFLSSMKKSWDIFSNPKNKINALRSLKVDKADSFVIVPLKAFNHMFSTLIRRKKDEFSFTIVNKGYRMPNRSKYEEFIVPKSKVINLLKIIDEGMGDLAVESFYTEFEKNSIEKYKLNITSKNQKSGNCFIKEPETAIKYAYATRNFSLKDFEKYRINFEDYTKLNTKANTKFEEFKPKWGIPTAQMHGLFIREIKKENPGIEDQLDGKFKIYLENKKYRNGLKLGKDSVMSLLESFDHNMKHLNENEKNICTEYLAKINTDTVRQNTPNLNIIIKHIGNDELVKAFYSLLDLSTNEDIQIYFDRRENFAELTRKLNEIKKFFPVFESEIKREFHLYYLIKSNGLYENHKDCDKALDFCKKANSLYEYNARAHFYEGYYTYKSLKLNSNINNIDDLKLYKQAITCFSKSISLKADLGDSYLLRGRIFEKLNKVELAKKDFENAAKFGCVIVGHGSILRKNNNKETLQKLI